GIGWHRRGDAAPRPSLRSLSVRHQPPQRDGPDLEERGLGQRRAMDRLGRSGASRRRRPAHRLNAGVRQTMHQLTPPDDLERRYDEFYERYGRPLEDAHSGEFLAVSPRGETVLSLTRLDVAQRAKAKFGPGCFLYKIGERSVGRIR